jgi:hypothetical protein
MLRTLLVLGLLKIPKAYSVLTDLTLCVFLTFFIASFNAPLWSNGSVNKDKDKGMPVLCST